MGAQAFITVVAVVILLRPVALAEQAQPRQVGGVGIAVFEDSNFRGRNATFRTDTPDLVRFGLNDRISSLRVAPGERWEACEHVNYGGRCQVFSGSESNLGRIRWNDTISSLRRVRGGGVRPPLPGPGPGPRGRILLYDEQRFRGRSVTVTGALQTLSGFNNRAESVRVFGGTWELCEETRFRGRCVTVSSDVSDLGSLGFRNRVASARPQLRVP